MKTTKKAQTEAFGLAIVVILIFMGLFFVIKFQPKSAAQDERIKYTDQVIAQNMLTSILGLNTTCTLGMSDLIKDCYKSKTLGTDAWICDGKPSCEYVSKVSSNILKNTLEIWNKNYYFEIKGTGIKKEYGTCLGEITPGSQPLPLSDGTSVEVILNICRD